MKLKLLLYCLVLAFLLQGKTYSQCCTAGNPVGTNCQLEDGGKDILNISLSYFNSFSDTYYKGMEKLDKQYIESYYNFASLGLTYGLSGKLRITGDLGYYFNKAQKFVNSDYTKYASGITDGTLGIIYKTYTSDDKLFEINQSAKVTIPLGPFEQLFDGVKLPIDLQPSSGNFRYNLGVILSKRFEGSDFSLLSFNSIEMSQPVITKYTYHKYGNLYNLSVMGIYRISDMMSGALQLRWEIRERALNSTKDTLTGNFIKYTFLNASGGVIGYISPQVNMTLFKDWMFSLQFNYPIYKNVYGEEQLTNKYSLSANISKSINFSSEKPIVANPSEDKSLSSFTLNVSGNCEMCKERIEKTVNEIRFVAASEWDSETKKLTVYYKTSKPDADEIEKAIAAVGHDTDKYKAEDAVYSKLPKCCLYRSK